MHDVAVTPQQKGASALDRALRMDGARYHRQSVRTAHDRLAVSATPRADDALLGPNGDSDDS